MEQPIPHLPKPSENMPPDHLLFVPDRAMRTHYFLNPGAYEDYPLYTNGIEEAFRNSSTWYHSYHARHGLLVWLISGEVSYRIEKKNYLVLPRQPLFIPPGTEYYFETTKHAGYHKFVAFFQGVNLPSILETLKLNHPIQLSLPQTDLLARKLRLLRILIRRRPSGHILQNAGLTLELLMTLSEAIPRPQEKSLFLRLACEKLSGNFEHPESIASIAWTLGMNERTFSRLFRAQMNQSPHRYRMQRRMEAACELLTQTGFSVKEIAFQLGFCNSFYFCNQFRRIHGVTPTQFRRRKRFPDR
mgnify:CR=1 FL=1